MPAEKNREDRIGIVLLAAGRSSRLGRPKQLLEFKGQTLLQHSLSEVLACNAQTVVVVLGAGACRLEKEIAGGRARVVINANWQEGMASSIRRGIEKLVEINEAAEGMILTVCDQPFINAGLLNNLIKAHRETNKKIIACSYENSFGPPVFFHQTFFPELLQLKGDIGARSVVQQHIAEVEAIPFPEGKFDIDTESDYDQFKER